MLLSRLGTTMTLFDTGARNTYVIPSVFGVLEPAVGRLSQAVLDGLGNPSYSRICTQSFSSKKASGFANAGLDLGEDL